MTTLAQALPRRRSLGLAWIRRYVLTVYAALALVYLFLPIAIVILFSFNNPAGRFNYTWQGFTFKNWTHPLDYPGLSGALRISIEIALLSSLVATIFGTLIALALVRYAFRGRGLTNLLIFMPMTTPEVVMGASLLALFVGRGVVLGFLTIFIAHVMFNISYVVVTVKARLVGFDRHLEEAAMDLGANEWTTFQKVTLPLIAPGITAAALLAFALSVDDFVIN
jgi:spermidine/putrescine transport system permease protein